MFCKELCLLVEDTGLEPEPGGIRAGQGQHVKGRSSDRGSRKADRGKVLQLGTGQRADSGRRTADSHGPGAEHNMSITGDLEAVVAAWPDLPAEVRSRILKLVKEGGAP